MRHHKSSDYFRVLILRTLGNFLIISSLFMIAKTFYQPVYQEIKYFVETNLNKKYFLSDDLLPSRGRPHIDGSEPKGLLAQALNVKPAEILIPEDSNFSIVIPKIGANARVIVDVDASNEEIYLEALQGGVAHASGTAYPGEGGHIFLFAHSTDYIWNVGNYNAIFYLLNKLDRGDIVNLFYQGQRYVYQVTGKKIIDASEVEYLTKKTDKEFLTLQTCWPPGTTLKRLLVFSKRVAD